MFGKDSERKKLRCLVKIPKGKKSDFDEKRKQFQRVKKSNFSKKKNTFLRNTFEKNTVEAAF